MPALTQREMNQAMCSAPGCNHKAHEPLFLHGRCHPSDGSRVSYNPERGELVVACRRCEKLIATVAVAKG